MNKETNKSAILLKAEQLNGIEEAEVIWNFRRRRKD